MANSINTSIKQMSRAHFHRLVSDIHSFIENDVDVPFVSLTKITELYGEPLIAIVDPSMKLYFKYRPFEIGISVNPIHKHLILTSVTESLCDIIAPGIRASKRQRTTISTMQITMYRVVFI